MDLNAFLHFPICANYFCAFKKKKQPSLKPFSTQEKCVFVSVCTVSLCALEQGRMGWLRFSRLNGKCRRPYRATADGNGSVNLPLSLSFYLYLLSHAISSHWALPATPFTIWPTAFMCVCKTTGLALFPLASLGSITWSHIVASLKRKQAHGRPSSVPLCLILPALIVLMRVTQAWVGFRISVQFCSWVC